MPAQMLAQMPHMLKYEGTAHELAGVDKMIMSIWGSFWETRWNLMYVIHGCVLAIGHLQHITADTKWLLFCRRHLFIFLFNFDSPRFIPKGPINHMQTLVNFMAWHRIDLKQLSESMFRQAFLRIYMSRFFSEFKYICIVKSY